MAISLNFSRRITKHLQVEAHIIVDDHNRLTSATEGLLGLPVILDSSQNLGDTFAVHLTVSAWLAPYLCHRQLRIDWKAWERHEHEDKSKAPPEPDVLHAKYCCLGCKSGQYVFKEGRGLVSRVVSTNVLRDAPSSAGIAQVYVDEGYDLFDRDLAYYSDEESDYDEFSEDIEDKQEGIENTATATSGGATRRITWMTVPGGCLRVKD